MALVALSGATAAQPKEAAAILAAARQALGGEAKLSAVKSFTATGRTRQVRGDNLVPIEFEMFVQLPDRYLRKDEIPAQESGPTATGFSGDEILQDPAPPMPPGPPAGSGGSAPNPAALEAARRARVNAVKQDFVRLTLGMFAASFETYPLTFTYVGEAEAPQGKADVLDAKGANNFTLRLFINQQTHLPIMVSWQGGPAGRGRGPGGPMGPGQPPPAGPRQGPGEGGAAPSGERGAPPPAERGATPAAERGTPPSAPGAPPSGTPAAPGAGGRGAQGPPAEPGRGAIPGPGRGAGPEPGRGGPASPPVENRLYFADYRDVDGVQFPFRLRRAVGSDTIEETTFDRFRLNAKIDPRRFEPRK